MVRPWLQASPHNVPIQAWDSITPQDSHQIKPVWSRDDDDLCLANNGMGASHISQFVFRPLNA